METTSAKDSSQGSQANPSKRSGDSGSARAASTGARPIAGNQILARGREVLNEARTLASSLEEAYDEIEEYLREQMEQRPYATLGAAAGIGYILGGGLPSRLTGLLVSLGTRAAFTMAIQQLAPGVSTGASNNSPSTQTAAGREQ